MKLIEGFKNTFNFFKTTSSLSTHLPLGLRMWQFDEIDKNGQPIPLENRKYMTILEEGLFYFFSLVGLPILFPIIFKDPKRAAGFVRQFGGIEGEKAFLEKLSTSPQHHADQTQ
ncbi:MAG: hypothetical protein Fur009_5340 [Candidatus Microgenomates bacterium]